jgi:hypothetical protein
MPAATAGAAGPGPTGARGAMVVNLRAGRPLYQPDCRRLFLIT